MEKETPVFTVLEGMCLACAAQLVLCHTPEDCPEVLKAILVTPLITALEKLDEWLGCDARAAMEAVNARSH